MLVALLIRVLSNGSPKINCSWEPVAYVSFMEKCTLSFPKITTKLMNGLLAHPAFICVYQIKYRITFGSAHHMLSNPTQTDPPATYFGRLAL